MANLEDMNRRMFEAIQTLIQWLFNENSRLSAENKQLKAQISAQKCSAFDKLIDSES